VIEQYPTLKSSEVVLGLMDELAGSENRIAVERRRYNERVRRYNALVLGIPGNLMAAVAGFKTRPYFRADLDAQSAPKIP
jgi:LemA protein